MAQSDFLKDLIKNNYNSGPISHLRSSFDRPNERSPFSGNRNIRKEIILSMEGSGTLIDNSPDWRDIENNHVCQVDKRIGLFSKEIQINPKLEMPLKDQKDFVQLLSEGLERIHNWKRSFDALSTLASIKKGGDVTEAKKGIGNSFQTIVRKISKLSAFDPEKFKSLFDSLQFKVDFSFGQFGIFDAYEEVVKPVCALMGIIAPNYNGKDDGGIGLYTVPYPTANQLYAFDIDGLLAKDLATFDESIAEKSNNVDSSKINSLGGLLNGANQFLENILLKGYAGIVNKRAGYQNGEFRFANFRYGPIKIGPCILNSIDGDFDFTKLDENGYPYKGSVTINASDIRTANSNVAKALFLDSSEIDFDKENIGNLSQNDGGFGSGNGGRTSGPNIRANTVSYS